MTKLAETRRQAHEVFDSNKNISYSDWRITSNYS